MSPFKLVILLVLCLISLQPSLQSQSFLKNLFRAQRGQRERPGFWYQVQPGDTLFGLSQAYHTPVQELKRINRLHSDNLPLKRIWIPRGTYNLAKNDLPHPHPRKKRIKIPKPAPKKPRSMVGGSGPSPKTAPKSRPKQKAKRTHMDFQWPVKSPVIPEKGFFGMVSGENRNSGIWIEVGEDQPVYPARSGKTVFAGHLQGYGHTVILDHLDNYFTVYSHLGKLNRLKKNQKIASKQVLGYTKSPKNQKQALLGFEVRHLNEALDPLLFLDRNRAKIRKGKGDGK
jgi:murein DD-endopeptidase MepM/ murein hydrolase activator NlpD